MTALPSCMDQCHYHRNGLLIKRQVWPPFSLCLVHAHHFSCEAFHDVMKQQEDFHKTQPMTLDFSASRIISQINLFSFINYPVCSTLLQKQKTEWDFLALPQYIRMRFVNYEIRQNASWNQFMISFNRSRDFKKNSKLIISILSLSFSHTQNTPSESHSIIHVFIHYFIIYWFIYLLFQQAFV